MRAKFEEFLGTIPLDRYREELERVKTVEQDLPKNLNPLPSIYDRYWYPQSGKFVSFEEFFESWWDAHLKAVDEFVKKYFWGCSWEFVKLGFKARIYRTLISVLTQFHFLYLWKDKCRSPVKASAELDMSGADALADCCGRKVILQIKKESYRKEARRGSLFLKRNPEYSEIVVVYTLARPEELRKKLERARKRKDVYERLLYIAENYQHWLDNGFVIFKGKYPVSVEEYACRTRDLPKITPWEELVDWLKQR